jgi:arylsulfatase A-like enzyme
MNEAMIRFLLLGLLGLAAVLGQEQGGRNGIEGLDTRALHERGMEHFFAGRIEDSIKDWDREIELIPRRAPYHWQRGLALYYAGEFEKGVTQFVSHQKVNGNDVENAVWHFLCVVRAKGGSVEKARGNLIPIVGDSRVPMREVHNLFSDKGSVEDVLKAASSDAEGIILRNQLCYAHLCLGLYFEALDQPEKSSSHMKKAAVDFKMDHYMGKVAQLHHRLRKKKPNIIFLFADDQRADTIAAHGNQHIQTPHLDQLVERGFSFRENYCAGSFSGAVCVASRAMLMTGRHWMKLPKKSPGSNWGNATLLPSYLTKTGGYRSHIVGKWHNGEGTLRKAFSEGSSVYMGGMANHADFAVQDYQGGKLSPKRPAGGFSSEVFANDAVKFIETADGKDPFFLYVAFMAPHDPRNPPEKYREIYYKNRPPLPKNFLPQHPFKIGPAGVSGRDESLAPWPRTTDMIGDQLCEYYGLVTHLDEQVGRIMKALEGSPHADNTYVIYTADHGLAMGSHGLLGKQNVYEQSMKSPLIIWGPDVPAGQSSEAFSYVHDLYSTVVGLAGVPAPGGNDSRDLGPVMRGEKERVHEAVFLPFQKHQRAIRDRNWKLQVYPNIDHRLLFDLRKDPHEMNNLAGQSEYAGKEAEMVVLMGKFRTRLGDSQPLKVANPQPKVAVYDNAKRSMDVWQPKWIRGKYFDGRDTPNHGSRQRK